MGLETVELVLAIEDEFGIVIEDSEAEKISTPRQLAEYVISLLKLADTAKAKSTCITQSQFYKLRSIFIKEFGALRRNIRLDTPIENLIQIDVQQQWEQLTNAIRNTLSSHEPENTFSNPPGIFSYFIGLSIFALIFVLALTYVSPVAAFFVSLIFAVMFIASFSQHETNATLKIKTKKTVRELVPLIGIMPSPQHPIDPEFVLHRIISLTSYYLDTPIDLIHPDSHFIKDLGAG